MIAEKIECVINVTLSFNIVCVTTQAFLKHQMVEPVLSVLFPIMCAGSEEDEDEEEIDDAECRMPSMYAPQVSSWRLTFDQCNNVMSTSYQI